jgi:hypothetical protein
MALKNMAQTAEEAKEYGGAIASGEGDKYPYGLCLQLSNSTLEKLGWTKLPAVGSTVTVIAQATVVSTGERQEQDGDTEQNVSLQITDMDLGASSIAASDKSNADKLYS